MLGPSDLDISSVEIVPGTAAALYGLNAINGLANFQTKNPFNSEGLSVQQKTGVNHLGDANSGARLFSETSLRYARVLRPRLAFKVNGTYLRGYDWVAHDQTDLNPNGNASTGLFGADNPARDPVSSYGNESSDRSTLSWAAKATRWPAPATPSRTWWTTTCDTLKADAALHYRFRPGTELAYTYRVAGFDNVYQRSNRFRLQGYRLQQHAVQLSSPWCRPAPTSPGKTPARATTCARRPRTLTAASSPMPPGTATTPPPGTPPPRPASPWPRPTPPPAPPPMPAARSPARRSFRQRLSRVQDINNWDVGAALRVRARLLHAEAQVNVAEALRRARPPPARHPRPAGRGRPPHLHRGARWQLLHQPQPRPGPARRQPDLLAKPAASCRPAPGCCTRSCASRPRCGPIKTTTSACSFNPRFTAVYSPSQQANFRLSYQSGYRFPSLFEGFSNVNSGQVKRIGGLRVMSDGVFENSYLRTSIDAFVAANTAYVNANTPANATAGQKQAVQNQAIAQQPGLAGEKPLHLPQARAHPLAGARLQGGPAARAAACWSMSISTTTPTATSLPR